MTQKGNMPESESESAAKLGADYPVTTAHIGRAATLACIMEATAPKVGNVHRGADFEDLAYYDFVVAAVAIAESIADARRIGVGQAVLQAITATKDVANTNVNLGIALLMAPLAAADPSRPINSETVREVLQQLTADDSKHIYDAIRLAQPSGLGNVDDMDVRGEAPARLLDAMAASADRDLVAQQYADEFHLVLGPLADALSTACDQWGWPRGIVHVQILSLAERPDSLIARKCGVEVANTARARAGAVIDAGPPGSAPYDRELADLDFWMRSDGNRRNPGATADLLAASLFCLLRDGRLRWNRQPPPPGF